MASVYTEAMKQPTFSDYDGPTGLFVATGEKIVALGSVEGIAAVAQSAMLTSLGSTPAAKQYEAAAAATQRRGVVEAVQADGARELGGPEDRHLHRLGKVSSNV